jgi:hypothetical protein
MLYTSYLNICFFLLQDVLKLNRTLPNVVELYCIPWDKFNHIDFLWANDVNPLINDRVMGLMKRFETL